MSEEPRELYYLTGEDSDQVDIAASLVHRTWQNHPNYGYGWHSLREAMLLTVLAKPERYLAEGKRHLLCNNLRMDFNRQVGDRLGVARPGPNVPKKRGMIREFFDNLTEAEYAVERSEALMEAAEDESAREYPYLTLRYLYGFTIPEIAKMRGESTRTADRRVRAERDRLKANNADNYLRSLRPRVPWQGNRVEWKDVLDQPGFSVNHELHEGCELNADQGKQA